MHDYYYLNIMNVTYTTYSDHIFHTWSPQFINRFKITSLTEAV